MAEDHSPLRTSEELTDRRQVISVDTLPDDVLLVIFDYYVNDDTRLLTQREEAWQSLVHVCRRWRCIIFGSPRHLNLQLVCQERTPVRDVLDVWPALPLIIWCYNFHLTGADNIIAVLWRSVRVCRIELMSVQSSDLEKLLVAMQQPFPELTNLSLCSYSTVVPAVPDSFLGGSAPRLQRLMLGHIPFPGLPKLLLSATHLVELRLFNIPHSGYITPNAMVNALSALTSLSSLTLEFRSPRSCPDRASRRPPPSTRSVLPILGYFRFKGITEYLEDLVARIDAPRLNKLNISSIKDIVFDTPRFMQFISRTPTSRALENAHITLRSYDANLHFSSQASGDGDLYVEILRQGLNWQLSSLEQVCISCLPHLSMLEDLCIYEDLNSQPDWKDDVENGLWVELLHPFTAVKNFYLSEEIALHIGPALHELAEGRTAEVLPALQNIFLDGLESSGPVQGGIGKFVAARQVAGRPIAVSSWANSDRDKGYYQDD